MVELDLPPCPHRVNLWKAVFLLKTFYRARRLERIKTRVGITS